MSLSLKSLVKLAQVTVGDAAGAATGNSVYTYAYATADAAAAVETAGYFNNARKLLAVGSVIQASMVYGGTSVLKNYVVTAVPATGNVTIALAATAAG